MLVYTMIYFRTIVAIFSFLKIDFLASRFVITLQVTISWLRLHNIQHTKSCCEFDFRISCDKSYENFFCIYLWTANGIQLFVAIKGIFFGPFFSMWVFFHNHSRITRLQGKGEGISLTSP